MYINDSTALYNSSCYITQVLGLMNSKWIHILGKKKLKNIF